MPAIASKKRRSLIWPFLALAWPFFALAGVVLLTEPWHGEIGLVGVGFALAAGTCWGLHNVFTQLV